MDNGHFEHLSVPFVRQHVEAGKLSVLFVGQRGRLLAGSDSTSCKLRSPATTFARHEYLSEGPLDLLPHALLHMNRAFRQELSDEGEAHILLDGPIILDSAAEKLMGTAEVGVAMYTWGYRQKRCGEDEETAKARVRGPKVSEDEHAQWAFSKQEATPRMHRCLCC